VLNIADRDTPSVSEIASYIAQACDYKGRVVELSDVDTYPPPIVGRTPWSVQRPFILDTAAAAALGYAPRTTYRQTVTTVCDWLARTAPTNDWQTLFPVLASYPFNLFDYAAEDALLGADDQRP
jgi:nucleoside-diphosphate-sugar epimerase